MMPESLIVTVLALAMCAAAISLWIDARERRIDRRLAAALPASHPVNLPSIRRLETGSGSLLLHRLANYNPEIPYTWHLAYVLLAGAFAAAAILYANHLLGYSILYGCIAAPIAAIIVMRGLFGWQQRRVALQLFRQLPDAIQLVTSTVRTGLPVHEAFRALARDMPQPTAGQFAIVCSEVNLGRPLEEAVEAVYRRTQVAEYAMFAVTLAVQLKSGGALAETLQNLGDTVRQRVALAARAKAMAGEVIFSSRALTISPLLGGGVLCAAGNKLLAYAVASVLVGALVISWMVRRETEL
jgi:tight adherence protein B